MARARPRIVDYTTHNAWCQGRFGVWRIHKVRPCLNVPVGSVVRNADDHAMLWTVRDIGQISSRTTWVILSGVYDPLIGYELEPEPELAREARVNRRTPSRDRGSGSTR